MKGFRKAYMSGWDAEITNKRNPYKRSDYRSWFDQGKKDCKDGKHLPWFYWSWKGEADDTESYQIWLDEIKHCNFCGDHNLPYLGLK